MRTFIFKVLKIDVLMFMPEKKSLKVWGTSLHNKHKMFIDFNVILLLLLLLLLLLVLLLLLLLLLLVLVVLLLLLHSSCSSSSSGPKD
jgi:hypothetical protein